MKIYNAIKILTVPNGIQFPDMNITAVKTILIFALIFCCAFAKSDDYYENVREFKRSSILANCEQEILNGFVEVDPRPHGGFCDCYIEIADSTIAFAVDKEESISIYKYKDRTKTMRSIYCRNVRGWRNINISIDINTEYDSKDNLKYSEQEIRNNGIVIYSNRNEFEDGKLIKMKQNKFNRKISQGETPCEIVVAEPWEKFVVFLLNPEHPIVLEQQLLIDPYDAIKYYWYPHCKIYGEQFIEKDGDGLFWRKHSRLFSPYWNKTDNQNPKEHL